MVEPPASLMRLAPDWMSSTFPKPRRLRSPRRRTAALVETVTLALTVLPAATQSVPPAGSQRTACAGFSAR